MAAIRFNPGATADFDEAADWYCAEDPDLKPQFIEAVNKNFARILSSPLSFPIVSGTQVRQAPVKRFPYVILFSIRPDYIWVYSIFHARRNPITWRGRID
jgi:plasmid stabilization system protein ParE